MKRILLADSQELFLRGLGELVSQIRGLEVIGQAKSGPEAVRIAEATRPDLVILDVALQEINGVDTTQRICSSPARSKVLCLAQRCDARTVTAALSAGATGYLLKSCSLKELQEAIKITLAKKIYLSPVAAGSLVEVVKATWPPKSSAFGLLTEREREVLQLLAEGRSASESADQLFVSKKTIHTHRKNIMGKLHIPRFANLIKYAIQEGLTSSLPEYEEHS